eukprot:3526670-Rhodomonas_salina.1
MTATAITTAGEATLALSTADCAEPDSEGMLRQTMTFLRREKREGGGVETGLPAVCAVDGERRRLHCSTSLHCCALPNT